MHGNKLEYYCIGKNYLLLETAMLEVRSTLHFPP